MSLTSQINKYIFYLHKYTHVNFHSSVLSSVAILHNSEEWMFWVAPTLFKFQLHYLLVAEHTSYNLFNFSVPQFSHLEVGDDSSHIIR